MLKLRNLFLITFLLSTLFTSIESSLKFNIPSYREKCFSQELYMEGTLLIRYDLTGFEKDYQGDAQAELFKNIKIFVKDEKGKIMYETELKSRKEKFAILLKERGIYLICARYFRPRRGRELSNDILMGLKIRNDYHYTNLEESLHREDVNNFWKKIRDIKRDIRPSIEASKLELKEEDKTAKSIISAINTYYLLSCFQLVIIIVITMFVVFGYQEFLKKKTII